MPLLPSFSIQDITIVMPEPGAAFCSPADPLEVELRMLQTYTQPNLEILRKTVLQMVSTDTMMTHRARGVLLIAHENDFLPVCRELLSVSTTILAEKVCLRRGLFAMTADLRTLDTIAHQARRELGALGVSRGYLDLIETRAISTSPQQRVSAACATVLLTAFILVEANA